MDNLKNIVIVILASEFIKNLAVGDMYKKYINFAVSLVVIGFLISSLSSAKFDITAQTDFNYAEVESNENLILKEYKKNIAEKLAKKFPENETPEFEIEVDNEYNVVHIKVNSSCENAGKILEELGFMNYEIID